MLPDSWDMLKDLNANSQKMTTGMGLVYREGSSHTAPWTIYRRSVSSSTHIYRHTQAHIRTYMPACTCTDTRAYILMYRHTCLNTLVCRNLHTHVKTHTHTQKVWTHICTYINTHTTIYTCLNIHTLTHVHMYKNTRTLIHMHKHTHTLSHIHIYKRKHPGTHLQTHQHIHIHMYKHTYIQTYIPTSWHWSVLVLIEFPLSSLSSEAGTRAGFEDKRPDCRETEPCKHKHYLLSQ